MKLERAESLITGLADERDRWELSLESYRAKLSNIPGDALLGAAFMSYAGPFTSSYRSRLVRSFSPSTHWIQVELLPLKNPNNRRLVFLSVTPT